MTSVISATPAQAAAGDFSIDFVAAAPLSYNHLTGGGAFDDRTIGDGADVVESLEGSDFQCGDIVTYLAAVDVDDTASAAADAPQTIELDFEFLADTTGQSGVATGDITHVGVNYAPVQDLIPGEDDVDGGIVDDGGSTATLVHEELVGAMFEPGAVLQGTVQLTDLEAAEQVVVRVDTKLFCDPGSAPTGNLQGALPAARLVYVNGDVAVTPPAPISVGNQTIPFLQVGGISMPAISVEKTVTTADGTCPGVESLTVFAGESVTYCYVVTNPSDLTDPPGAPMYDVTLVDDNGTPADTSDDFPVSLTGLADVDGDGTADDLAAGGSATGSAIVEMSAIGEVTNTALATGQDSVIAPTSYTDTDTASVTVQTPPDVAPMPRVVKGAEEGNDNVATLDEPGGSVTIPVTVYNDASPGTGDATLTALVDDVYGDITTIAHDGITATTCETGGVIAGGSSYSCSFTVDVTGEPRTVDDTVTATLLNDHSAATDTDMANVVISDVAPSISVEKTADPTSMPEPGGLVEFTVVVSNDSAEPVTLMSLTDDVYGNIADVENTEITATTCETGGSIAAGATYTCTFTAPVTGQPGSYTDTVEAVAEDNDGSSDTASDDATVDLTGVAPTIEVIKTADPFVVDETGEDVTFMFTVTNTSSFESVWITSLTDSVYGDLAGDDDCKVGTELAPEASCTFSITRWVEGDFGDSAHVNLFAAAAEDDDKAPATGEDDATVGFTDVMPSIVVDKTADPTEVPEPGGEVTFAFTVSNTGTEELTITSLVDSELGTLAGDADCMVGTILAAGDSCEFSVTEWVEGDASGTMHHNVFTATGEDDDGNEESDTDEATVGFTDVMPTIDVDKAAAPTAVPETGGDVTFTFTVTNTSSDESVTITSLSDSVYGTLAGDADCAVDTVLPADGSCSFELTTWVEGDYIGPDHVDLFTAHAVDNDGNDVSASDDATVDFTDVAPEIEVTKVAYPTYVPETGGDVTFTFTVTNTSSEEPVTITSLSDSVYGALSGDDDCKVGTELAAGASCEFSISEWVEGDYSGPAHENVFTGAGEDNDGTGASDFDDETVGFIDVLPTLKVTKTAAPTSVPETGGQVTFTFVVENTSTEEPVTITSLADSVFDPLAGDEDCKVGTELAAGASCEFSISEWVEGDHSGPDHVNTFTAYAVDDDGSPAWDDDDATVDFTDVAPTIVVDKTADPASVPETGADVIFTFTVLNISSEESVTITSLEDSVFGELAGDEDCRLGTDLPPEGYCTFEITEWIEGDYGGDDHVDVFTAKAVDNDATEAKDDDDATVAYTDVLPDISVTKTASPTSVIYTGGYVDFSIRIDNNATEDAVLDSLTDPLLELSEECEALVGETIPAGGYLECAVEDVWIDPLDEELAPYVNVVTATASDDDDNRDTAEDDATVTFWWYGRTPGFWKNHTDEWPDGYTPDMLVQEVFAIPACLLDNNDDLDIDKDKAKAADTLLAALNYKGGKTEVGKAQILLRAAVAGLLNEAYYGDGYPPYESVEVLIAAVDDILATCEGDAYVELGADIDYWNNGEDDPLP